MIYLGMYGGIEFRVDDDEVQWLILGEWSRFHSYYDGIPIEYNINKLTLKWIKLRLQEEMDALAKLGFTSRVHTEKVYYITENSGYITCYPDKKVFSRSGSVGSTDSEESDLVASPGVFPLHESIAEAAIAQWEQEREAKHGIN